MMKAAGSPFSHPGGRTDGQTSASSIAEPVLLIIADISGYTRYMTANAKTLSHSHTIIRELVEAIIHEVQLPLEVAKLEGDAIFLYCRKSDDIHSWARTRQIISEKLLVFFAKFTAKVADLSRSTTCACNACTHIDRLRLKVVVHSGEALFHHVFNFFELAGVDVIIVHRLLKNSVRSDQYLLLTEAAARDLEFPAGIELTKGSENYDDVGKINTLLYLPANCDGEADVAQSEIPTLATSAPRTCSENANFKGRFACSWKLYWKLWFAPFRTETDPQRNKFRHVVRETGTLKRFGFLFLTCLLTPFMLPVGTLSVLYHSTLQRHACKKPSSSFK